MRQKAKGKLQSASFRGAGVSATGPSKVEQKSHKRLMTQPRSSCREYRKSARSSSSPSVIPFALSTSLAQGPMKLL